MHAGTGRSTAASRRSIPWRIAVLAMLSLLAVASAGGETQPKLPVILIYGFQPVPGFHPTRVWETFAERLSGRSIGETEKLMTDTGHAIYRLPAADDAHFEVFLSHYAGSLEPTVRDLRYYASRLAAEIAWVRSFSRVEAVDLVGHSMGGLVARCYVEAGDFEHLLGIPGFSDYGVEYRHDVRTLVTLATPHHGAVFSSFGTWLGPLLAQLAADSPLLAVLNAAQGDGARIDASVRYVSMAGQSCLGCGFRRDVEACRYQCAEDGMAWLGSDLVVEMEAARLEGAEHTACLGMNHVDMHAHPVLANALADILSGQPAPTVVFGTAELQTVLEAGGAPS